MITIQNNDGDRRVLLLDSPFALDESPDFPEYLFDVVFIANESAEETKTILNSINPVTSTKCCYKPLFVSSSLKGKMGNYGEIIDGYADDWNDMEVMTQIENIIAYNTQLGLNAQEDPILSSNQFFIRLTRFLISRRKTILEPKLDVSASTGYVIPVFDLFYRLGHYELSEYFVFMQSMTEKGLFRTSKFVNKVYLCPKCLHSHMLYIHSCPKCGQSSIKIEEVIHHFRCANVSPEHTYNFGGQLRCPKCHKILRHIGVDFDRPATVHTCNTCGNTFIEPKIKTICTSCHHQTSDADELIPQDFNIYEITSEGKQSIISPNIGFTIYTEFYDNYVEYNRFVNRIRLLAEQKFSGNIKGDLLVGKIWILNENEETMPIRPEGIELACLYFPSNKVSAANNITYVSSIIRNYTGDTEEGIINFQVMLSETIRATLPILNPGEKICTTYMKLQGNQSTIDDFIKEMDYVSSSPDDTVAYNPAMVGQKPELPRAHNV
ncbi:MAG: hypothetical protein IJR02_08060 [Bacteroidaceae bacterium]|nr:hypothetical protein [Bacteroidaceae bacterium]MBQ6750704.1 hypothetical protein [Bacteroidaceae bacterium]